MADIGHNSGLSPEDAAESMKRALAPHKQRAEEFASKAQSAQVDDMPSAQAAVDFVRMARALADKGRELLDEVRQPYKDAAEAARGVAMQFIEDLEESVKIVNDRLAAYNAERRRRAQIAEEEQREAEAELRRRAAEAEGEEVPAKSQAPAPTPAPTVKKAAPIRTDYGGRMSDQVKWRPNVVDVTKVPEHVLKSPKVIAAIEQVSRDLLKNGIEVPGVEKQEYNSHSIS